MSKHYLRAVAAKHSERVTLAGQPAGTISEADRLKAAGELKALALRAVPSTPKPPPPQTPRPPPPPPASGAMTALIDVAATLGVGE
jgi:hypothetical protein